MTKMSQEDILGWTVDLAKQAGEVLLSYFGTDLTHNIKKHKDDFATEADHASEAVILAAIRKTFPGDAIVAEESGVHEKEDAEHTWIVDPLDGTYHFAHHSDNFGVLISRANREGEIDLAVAYKPTDGTVASVALGQGVYLNGEKIDLRGLKTDDLLIVSNRNLYEPLKLVGDSQSDRSAIGGLLNSLHGHYKANVANKGLIWDFAPTALMLSEAGWKVTDFLGNDFRWDGKVADGYPGILAAPPGLHDAILRITRSL